MMILKYFMKFPGERTPKFSDRDQLNYTQAVIYEVFRRVPILPYGLPHFTKRDTEVNGYFIPKHTEVITKLRCNIKNHH